MELALAAAGALFGSAAARLRNAAWLSCAARALACTALTWGLLQAGQPPAWCAAAAFVLAAALPLRKAEKAKRQQPRPAPPRELAKQAAALLHGEHRRHCIPKRMSERETKKAAKDLQKLPPDTPLDPIQKRIRRLRLRATRKLEKHRKAAQGFHQRREDAKDALDRATAAEIAWLKQAGDPDELEKIRSLLREHQPKLQLFSDAEIRLLKRCAKGQVEEGDRKKLRELEERLRQQILRDSYYGLRETLRADQAKEARNRDRARQATSQILARAEWLQHRMRQNLHNADYHMEEGHPLAVLANEIEGSLRAIQGIANRVQQSARLQAPKPAIPRQWVQKAGKLLHQSKRTQRQGAKIRQRARDSFGIG